MAYHVSLFRVDLVDDVDKSHDRSGSNPQHHPWAALAEVPEPSPAGSSRRKKKRDSNRCLAEEGQQKKKLGQMQPACFKALVLFFSLQLSLVAVCHDPPTTSYVRRK